ncbi:type II toxin-antitoxin system HigA family antitoxin [Dyadobacter sp. CY343]|uniref:helix-turn-helix domain-containing protein n=1 Tax=Dyadobacter sp. CY343 TaxID=2907299 RepID=UPI001F4132C9|nr:helix-turn-helix domain-containing protein [Dyadobacter sp. CY343]MCE7059506.1 transcriptional regulator [Dyadobacter sp. CY343]
MSTVPVTPLKTALDYRNALNRIDALLILNPPPFSELDDELDVLSTLVHAYEQTHHAILYPDPIDAIKYLMEENGWKNKDLEQYIGPKSRVSEILNRKRYFTLQQIHNLHKHLGLPLEIFINEKMPAIQ